MQSMTAFARSRRFVLVPALAVLAGCSSKAEVENKFDPPSLVRLSAIPDGATVVVSCRLREVPDRLPLGDKGKELARTASSVLIEIAKSDLNLLGKLPNLQLATVWGDAKAVHKLDPRLQATLLGGWENPSPSRHSLLARFAPGTADVRGKLEAQGVGVRTVAGTVVTLDADTEAVLRLLEIRELESLSASKDLRPSGG